MLHQNACHISFHTTLFFLLWSISLISKHKPQFISEEYVVVFSKKCNFNFHFKTFFIQYILAAEMFCLKIHNKNKGSIQCFICYCKEYILHLKQVYWYSTLATLWDYKYCLALHNHVLTYVVVWKQLSIFCNSTKQEQR